MHFFNLVFLGVNLLGELVVLGTLLACNKSRKSELLSCCGSCVQPSSDALESSLSTQHGFFRDDLSPLVKAQVLLHETSFGVHCSTAPNTSHGTCLHLSGHSLSSANSSGGLLRFGGPSSSDRNSFYGHFSY